MRAPMRPVVIETRPMCYSCLAAYWTAWVIALLLVALVIHVAPDVWDFLVLMASL